MRIQQSYLEDFINDEIRKNNILNNYCKLYFNENYNDFYDNNILKQNYQNEFIYILSKF